MIKKYFDIKLLSLAILSAVIHAIAITSFTIPAQLYPAGFSGISRFSSDILNDYFNINIPYAVFYFLLNIIASIIVYRKIGKKFTIYSIIQFSLVSIFTTFFPRLFILEEKLLYCVFGGIINGLAAGIALASDFSTGGFDFISVYFSNRFKKSFWNYSLFINIGILILSGIVYGPERALYSIIFQFCSVQIVKTLHKRFTFTTLLIITKKPDEVASTILKSIRHGITEMEAKGFYSNSDETMLYTVVNTFQYRQVIDIVLSVDKNAFINVQPTVEIHGNYYQKPLE